MGIVSSGYNDRVIGYFYRMVKDGYDPVYGARPVKRLIQRELVNKLARAVLEGTVRKSSTIEVDCDPDGKVLLRNK